MSYLFYKTKGKMSETEIKNINAVSKSIKDFEAVQVQYSKFGANDSEVTCILHELIEILLSNKDEMNIPSNSDEWALYREVEGVDTAASALTEAARHVINIIEDTMNTENGADAEAVVTYLREYFTD